MWDKDPAAEHLMQRVGLSWQYKTGIAIGSIRIEESKKNNARFGQAIDPDLVLFYAKHIQNMAPFPAPILSPTRMVIAGNHRLAGAVMASQTVINAYEATGTKEQMDEFMRLDNIRHGKTLSEEQKVLSVSEIHRATGKSVRSLNEEYFGNNERTYELIIKANHAKVVELELLKMGVGATNIPHNVRSSMYPLRHNTRVLREAGLCILEMGLQITDAQALVVEVQEAKTEADQIAAIGTYKKERKAKVVGKKEPIITTTRKALAKFLSFLETGNDGNPIGALVKLTADAGESKRLKELATSIINALRTK